MHFWKVPITGSLEFCCLFAGLPKLAPNPHMKISIGPQVNMQLIARLGSWFLLRMIKYCVQDVLKRMITQQELRKSICSVDILAQGFN